MSIVMAMGAKLTILALLVFTAQTVYSVEQKEPQELVRLRSSFQRKVEEVLQPLRNTYLKELERLEKSLSGRSQVKEALIVREERVRVSLTKEGEWLNKLPDRPEKLQRLSASVRRRADSALLLWKNKYRQLLTGMESKWRKEGKLQDALAAQKEIDALREGVEKTYSGIKTLQGGFFNGIDQYVDFGVVKDLNKNDGSNLSAFIWIKGNPSSSVPSVFGVSKSEEGGRSWLIQQGKGHLDFVINGAANEKTRKYYRIPDVFDNEWHHCGFSFKDGDVITYLDGKPVSPIKLEDDDFSRIFQTRTTALTLGARDSGVAPFSGGLKGAAIFGISLSSANVRDLYNKGSLREALLFCPFDEGKGSEIHDQSGNKNSGKVINLTADFWKE